MDVLYIFCFKERNKSVLNRVKRRFYYNLTKLNNCIKQKIFCKKQFFVVDEKDENKIDLFLNEYLDWIDYCKVKTNEIYVVKK